MRLLKKVIMQLMPHVFYRFMERVYKFRWIGFGRFRSLQAALTKEKIQALDFTCINLLPYDTTKNLKYIVDVGAHHGLWSRSILMLCQPQTIIAIEPSPRNRCVLRKNLEGISCVQIVEKAVGNHQGVVDFHLVNNACFSSILTPRIDDLVQFYREPLKVEEKISVPITTLDELLKDLPEISLLKIDVQGFEKEVLSGAKKILTKTKAVILEANFTSHYHHDGHFFELHSIMINAGFALCNLADFRKINNQLLWTDAVYAKVPSSKE